jgi:hypothetical protein
VIVPFVLARQRIPRQSTEEPPIVETRGEQLEATGRPSRHVSASFRTTGMSSLVEVGARALEDLHIRFQHPLLPGQLDQLLALVAAQPLARKLNGAATNSGLS